MERSLAPSHISLKVGEPTLDRTPTRNLIALSDLQREDCGGEVTQSKRRAHHSQESVVLRSGERGISFADIADIFVELSTHYTSSSNLQFDGWGPDLDAQPEEAQHSTSNLSKAKSNPTLYYGIFRGSGPSPAGYEEPKVDKPLTYNEKIAAAKSLSANDLNKGTSFYGLVRFLFGTLFI